MNDPQAIVMQPIGVIRSPHLAASGTPIQPIYAGDAEGEVVVNGELEPALADLEGFEHVWLLYWCDRAGAFAPRVVPYRDTREHGLFATRAPARPNPIGLSVVRLLARERNVLRVSGLDVLDGTPLLDLKPYIPAVDARVGSRAGWFDAAPGGRERADGRFHEPR